MPNKPKKGFIYQSGKGGGAKSTTLKTDDVQSTPQYLLDENGDQYDNPGYDPAKPFQGTPKKFLGIIPYTAGKDAANQMNTTIQLGMANQAALAPGNINYQKKLADLQTTQNRQNESFEAAKVGKSIVDVAQADHNMSTIPGMGGSYEDIANAFKTKYGTFGQQGTIAAPDAAAAEVSASKMKQQLSENERAAAQSKAPYMSTIGDLSGQGAVQQGQLGIQNAPALAAANLRQRQGEAFSAGFGGPSQQFRETLPSSLYNITPSSTRPVTTIKQQPIPGTKLTMPIKTEGMETTPSNVEKLDMPVSAEEAAASQERILSKLRSTPQPMLTTFNPPDQSNKLPLDRVSAPTMKNGKLEASVKPKPKEEDSSEVQDEKLKKVQKLLQQYLNQ